MEDLARLGLVVDSTDTKEASDALDRFSGKADKAAKSSDRFTGSAERQAKASQVATKTANALAKAVVGVVAGLASVGAAMNSAARSRSFSASMSETLTLLEGTEVQTEKLRSASMRLAATYGGRARGQMEAFYQSISAGAGSVAEASVLLDSANKLALGGVTDVATGVDGLTTVINAYGKSAITAADASDILFVGMRMGKTTIGEQARALGNVIPIAASLEVQFAELVAGVAALTTQGQTTSVAVTGVRQILASIVKPTKAASDEAERLGINFDVASLKSQGLAKFLDNIITASGGSEESLSQLFGSVEALNAVLSFAGGGGEKFNQILEEMGDRAGATDEAVAKMMQSIDTRMQIVEARFDNLAIRAGDALNQVLVPGFEIAADFAEMFADNIQLVASIAGAAAAVAITRLAVIIGVNFVRSVALAVTQSIALEIALGATSTTSAVASLGIKGMTAALVLLRRALILTGIGAFVVLAGYMIDRLLYLRRETGSWGAALSLLADIAKGVWEGIVAAAAAIPHGLRTVWLAVQRGFGKMIRNLGQMWADYLRSIAGSIRGIPGLEEAAAQLGIAAIDAQSQVGNLQTKVDDLGLSIEVSNALAKTAATDGFKKIKDSVLKLHVSAKGAEDALSETDDTTESLEKSLEGLNKILGDGRDSGGTAGALKKVDETAKKVQSTFEKGLSSAIDDFGRALGDLFTGQIDNFEDFRDRILGGFKQLISDMAREAVSNPIRLNLGLNGSASGVGSASGAGVTVLGGGTGGGGLLSNVLGGATGLLSAFGGGLSLGVSNILGGSYLAGLGAQFSTALTGSASAVAGLAGMAVPILAGIAILVKGFSRKYAGSGIRGTFGAEEGFEGSRFDFYKGGWFRSNKTNYFDLDAAFEQALDDSMNGMRRQVEAMAMVLDLGTDSIKDFVGEQFTIWTNGKTQEEIQTALTEQIEKVGIAMSEKILGEDNPFIRLGETALDTMTRLSTGIAAVNDMLDLLDREVWSVSLAAADLASNLVDTFGGLEAMSAAVGTYWQAFYTDAERQSIELRRLSKVFEALGLTMPTTRQGFRDLVESIDITTEHGQEMYAQLLNLSGALDRVLPSLQAMSATVSGLVAEIDGNIKSQINIAQDLARDSRQAAQLWYRTAETLRDFIRDLTTSSLSSVPLATQTRISENRFQEAMQAVMAGDVSAAQDLPGLASTFLQSAQANATSAGQYNRIFGQVQAALQFAAGISDLEGANDDVLVTLYEEQIEVLTMLGNFLQLSGLTSDQIDQLDDGLKNMVDNWDDSVDTLEGALDSIAQAIEGAEMFSYDSLINDLYMNISAAGNLPSDLRDLVHAAGNDIRVLIDFVIRKDLSAPNKWLAINSLSQHVKTIRFLTDWKKVGEKSKKLVLKTEANIRRNLVFILKKDLDPETRQLALVGNSELSKAVSVILDETKTDPVAMNLALGNIKKYSVAINAAFTNKTPVSIRNMLLEESGRFALSVHAGVKNLTGLARRVLLKKQGDFAINIEGILDSGLDNSVKRLLLRANTAGVRAVTIEALFGDQMTEEQRDLLKMESGNILRVIRGILKVDLGAPFEEVFFHELTAGDVNNPRTIVGAVLAQISGGTNKAFFNQLNKGTETNTRNIEGSVAATVDGKLNKNFLGALISGQLNTVRNVKGTMGLVGIGATKALFLDQLGKGTAAINKTIKGVVDLGKLTPQQTALLNAIGGNQSGTLSLSGNFFYDPSKAFSTWFSNTTQANLKKPMDLLRDQLDALRKAVDADRIQRENVIKLAKFQEVGTKNAELLGNAEAYAKTLKGKLDDLMKNTGVSLSMNSGALADIKINADGTLSLGGFEALVGAPGANFAEFRRVFNEFILPKIESNNANIVNRIGILDKLRDQVRALGGIPQFASGGYHKGGLRIVGERGPELDFAGPSRVVSAGRTSAFLDMAPAMRDMNYLMGQMVMMQEEANRLAAKIENWTDRMNRRERYWNQYGIPVTNTQDTEGNDEKLKVDTT